MTRSLVLLGLTIGWQQGLAQTFVYQEPGNPQCPSLVRPPPGPPKTVQSGVLVAGSVSVRCGFGNGSYTVILSTTDSQASFSPKTFLVNFGSLAGSGAFAVKFATPGEHTISATITSNMGSPALPGSFVSYTNVVNVVRP